MFPYDCDFYIICQNCYAIVSVCTGETTAVKLPQWFVFCNSTSIVYEYSLENWLIPGGLFSMQLANDWYCCSMHTNFEICIYYAKQHIQSYGKYKIVRWCNRGVIIYMNAFSFSDTVARSPNVLGQ